MNQTSICRALAFLCPIFILASCGQKSSDSLADRPAVRVKTVTVADSGVNYTRSFSGTVEEKTATMLSFSTAGTIKTLNVSEGDRISVGQLIGTLDDGSLRNAYQIAASTLSQAQDAYARMKQLHDANSLPDIKWVEVESKLRQAESAAEIARIALDDATLRSPVAGIVAEKTASTGQTIAPGMPVVKVVDISSVKVCISVPETEISCYHTGDKATITSESTPGLTFEGTVVEKGVSANPLTRAYTVKFRVDNVTGKLLPGMICQLNLADTHSLSGIILPVSAVLLAADNSKFVWLDSAGVACKRTVAVGEMLPEGIVIDSGLASGDKVIVAGTEKVSRGTKVESI